MANKTQQTDNKRYNLINFTDFVYEVLNKEYKGKYNYRELKEKVDSHLNNSNPKLLGETFYNVCIVINKDVGKMSEKFFKYHSFKSIELSDKQSKISSFLKTRINSIKLISTLSGINENRLGDFYRGKTSELYAKDVYGLAIVFNIQPRLLFDYFYGNGEKPVIEV